MDAYKLTRQFFQRIVHQVQIMNKIDRLEIAPRIDYDEEGNVKRIWVSAQQGLGIDLIHQVLADYFKQDIVKGSLQLSPADGRVRALLYGINAVDSEQVDEAKTKRVGIREFVMKPVTGDDLAKAVRRVLGQ